MTKKGLLAIAAVAVAAWLLAPVASSVQAQSEGLFSGAAQTLARDNPRWWADPVADAVPRTLRSRLARIDFGELDRAHVTAEQGVEDLAPLTLNLFDDTVFAARVEWSARTQSGYVLSGHLDGEPFGTINLVVNGAVVAGTVRTLRGTWRIRSVGAGLHLIRQVDLTTLPPAGEPLVLPVADRGAVALADGGSSRLTRVDSNPDADSDASVPASVIDVIVFYTPEARRHQGGKAEIEALIDLWVAETNQAYADSGVIQRLNLVRQEEVENEEEGNLRTDYSRFVNTSDGHMDNVYALREAYAADIMHLVAHGEPGDPCGVAVRATGPGSVTVTPSVSSSFCGAATFAHELGHSMGLRHDRYVDRDSNTPYPYSAGYVNQRAFDVGAPASSRWRTVMAYPNQCSDAGFSCTPLFRFSNPEQMHHGDPMGVPGDETSLAVDGPADARRSLNETRSIIVNQRNSQDRLNCKPVLAPGRQFVTADGGTFEVSVTIRHDCVWTAESDVEFVSVTRGANGIGSGIVEFDVAANNGSARAGWITIAGERVLIEQVGPENEGVCNRTVQVLLTITEAARADHCWQVTAAHLSAIDRLDLSDQGISELHTGDFSGLSRLRSLALSYNSLTTLPAGIFADLSTLQSLNLRDNELLVLPEEVFAGLSDVRALWLQENALSTLPAELFTGLFKLQSLLLKGNRLNTLPDGVFSDLRSLDALWMDNNELTELPPRVFADLSSLTTLVLSSNALTVLPEDIFVGPSKLHTLWIGVNELSELPEGIFSELPNLYNLRVGGNRLTSLPEEIFSGRSHLQSLDLANNQLTSLPSGIFADNTLLSSLWLFGNELTTLPAGIFSGLSRLHNLELQENPGAPFTIALQLVLKERTVNGGVIAVDVVEGAPFDMTLGLSATGGTLSADSVTVGAGDTSSPNVTVTRNDTTVTVRAGDAPPVPRGVRCGWPRCFLGLEIAVNGTVTLSN